MSFKKRAYCAPVLLAVSCFLGRSLLEANSIELGEVYGDGEDFE